MICTTIRKGMDCTFMAPSGCTYVKGFCTTIVDKCTGCNRIIEIDTGKYCVASPEPEKKWKLGKCNLATHIQEAPAAPKAKVNPLKASKRSAGKK